MENLKRIVVTMNRIYKIALYNKEAAEKYAMTLKLPGTEWYLPAGVTKDLLFHAAGFRSFDCALPQKWVNEYCLTYGKKPVGVWCYDTQTFGEFLPLSHALTIISRHVQKHGPDDTQSGKQKLLNTVPRSS